jgi:intraflagellar transport protein 46
MSLSDDDFDDDFDDDIGGKRSDDRGRDGDGDDFDFGESYTESPADKRRGNNTEGEGKNSTHLVNQPFDEAVDLSDEDSLGTSVDTIDPQNSPLRDVGASKTSMGELSVSSKRGDSPPRESRPTPTAEYGDDNDDGMSLTNKAAAANARPGALPSSRSPMRNTDSDATSAGEEDDDEEEDSDVDGLDESQDATPGKAKRVQGEYNPADYAHLNVSAEVKDLWNYIGRYKPHNIELETKLKCFIPDFIPAVGEIDAFIKVPPPGKEEEGEKRLGLKVLDEPGTF